MDTNVQSAPSFLDLFDLTLKKYPNRPALAGEFSENSEASSGHVTYAELDRHASIIVAALRQQGILAGGVVAIHTSSRFRAIASMIAVLRSGCAYLPLDPVYPAERLHYMVANANTGIVISDNDDFISPSAKRLDLRLINWNEPPETVQSPVIDPASDAYIIYTSGSTGRPKGVRMNHGTLNNLIRWQNAHYAADECFRTLQFSSLSFDVSFQEIFATFAQGGCLFLIHNQTKQDFRALLMFIDQQKIERIFLPYIALLQLLQWANRLQLYPQSLREVITAGEQLVVSDDLKKAFKAIPQARLSNQYGPSESHVVTEYILGAEIDAWEANPPIGKAIDQADILLLDEQLQPVADGESGELFIAGPVLANGYINNPDETAKRFVNLNISGKTISAYRTGDIASRREDGNIIYKGRIDSQVKISGYRVELSEVEAKLLDTHLLGEAAVAVRELRGDKHLVAFVVAQQDKFSLDQLKAKLEIDLPHYMQPSEYHLLPALLKTPTGKVDRKTMLEQLIAKESGSQQSVQKNLPVNQQILAIIRREIRQPSAQLSDNLIQQGMDSLAANRIAAALYDELNLSVPAYALFQHRSIKRFIDHATRSTQTSGATQTHEKSVDAEVAIIGMAVNVPGADRLENFWQNLIDARESVHYFEPNKNDRVNARGILKDPLGFDEQFFEMTPVEARFIDPQQRLLLELSWQALENAGYSPKDFPGRIGIYCGTGNNSYYLNNVLKNADQLEDFGAFQAMIANEKDYCATRIAYKLNLVGPAISVHSACSTSLVAVCHAVEAIRSGQCDIAIAGGASLTFPQQQPYEYQEGSIYSRDGHTRTFDRDSSGTVFSDGAGLVVLKRLDFAQQDGDAIYASVMGVAINNDGADKASFSAPSVEGQKHVIMAAQQNAGIQPHELGYVEAHGTATPIGDPIEVAALTAAFGGVNAARHTCKLGSVKSNFGHLTAAAGVVGMIKSALAIDNDLIPASLNFEKPNPALALETSPFVIANQSSSWNKPVAKRIAGISSFGIGGTNAHVILRGVDKEEVASQSPGWVPLCLSANNSSALAASINQLKDAVQKHNFNAADLAGFLARYRAAFTCRNAVAVDPQKNLVDLLSQVTANEESIANIENIAFSFPGQGSQVVTMGAELYQEVEPFRVAIDQADEILQQEYQIDLKALLFSSDADLKSTLHTQIVLFSVGYALSQTLIDLGIQPQTAIGHSIGELAAAVVAGVFDLPTGLRLVVTRGRAMQSQPAGAMIAVREPASAVEKYLSQDLVVAAQNTPESCTLAGSFDAIARVGQQLTTDGIKFKPLETSHAFHSPSMDGAKKLLAQLKDVQLNPPQLPFISCVTGDWITPEQATDINYWANQLRQPVKFYQGIQTLSQMPNLLVIECGPQRTVSGMMLQTLPEKSDLHLIHLLSAAGQSGKELVGFSQSLGDIWAVGVDVQWPATRINRNAFKFLPPYPFQHKTHVIEPTQILQQTQSISTTGTAVLETPKVISMKDAIISQLENLFSDISGMDLHNADRSAGFFELGLDSLLLTQSTLKLKKQFKVQVSFRQLLNECNNFGSLADYLVAQGVAVDIPAPVAAAPAAVSAPVAVTAPAIQMAPQSAPSFAVTNIAPQFAMPADGNVIALLQQQMQLLQGQLALLAGGVVPTHAPAIAANPVAVAQASAPQASAPATKESAVKPFGAGTRINVKRSNDMTAKQKANLDALTTRYTTKFKSSKAFAQNNRKQLADPRVVSGFRNTLKELIFPIVVERSEGAYLWDIDGTRFIDITCGFGSNFFGNGADFIRQAVHKQLDTGYEIGPQHPLMGEVSRLFCEVTGNERAAFCNTGSEAVIGAVRLARTVTAKEKIVIFENDYHGINDEVIVSRGANGLSTPAAAGIPEASVENVIVLDYGDEKSLDYIRDNADDIAALLIEPVQSRYPELQPREFLKKARQLCTDNNIAFIFDEVITGFRIHPRGAQGFYGIDADICTYGKIVGGGLPVGVIGGKKEFMDALDGGQWQYGDSSSPEVGVTYFAGTFVRHPLVLAAAQVVLKKIKAEPDLQDWLNARADRMVKEINDYAAMVGAPIKIANCGSMCKIKIPQDIPYEELIYILLREKGIHVWDARPTFITTAHSDEDLAYIVKAFKESMDEMLLMEFFPPAETTKKNNAQSEIKASAADPEQPVSDYQQKNFAPPVPGAKLGRDEQGRAVWFVPSKSDPTQFEKWQG
jgi:amino acid adenylation domain-containing protein